LLHEHRNYLTVLLEKRVDGILLVPAVSTAEPIELIHRQGTHVVVLDRRVPCSQVDVVRCDSVGGAYQLTRLLLGLGHRRIAILSGPKDVSTAEDRVEGYCRALAEAGLDADDSLIYYGEFIQSAGYEMMGRALSVTPWPTAVFGGNNFIAIGALRALREVGLSVPEDVALVTFDDLPLTLLIDPFLTVATQPAYEMGRQATDLLLDVFFLRGQEFVGPVLQRFSQGSDVFNEFI